MRQTNVFKLSIMSILIVLGIVQTALLWLGPLPSQNFFKPTQSRYKGIEPSGVWLLKPSASNAGGVSSFAYRIDHTIDETKREYEHLVGKMQGIVEQLERDSNKIKFKNQEVDWQRIFSKPSIVYEYEVPLELSDIAGLAKSAQSLGKIDTLVLQANNGFSREIEIYLISTQDQQMYHTTLVGDFKEVEKIYSYYTVDEILSNITKYQPSSISNISQYIKGNAFMPIASQHTPIAYEMIKISNPIEKSEYNLQELEKYVNDFFVNPLLKDSQIKEDGTVIFTEKDKNVVMYHKEGVLEYINLAPDKFSTQTILTGYYEAMNFIEKTEALTDRVKKGLYLERIEETNQGSTYYFNTSFNGYKVRLSEGVKKELGVEALLAITVKNNQITNCILPILELKVVNKGVYEQKGKLTTEYVEPINKALADEVENNEEHRVFEDVDTSYVITTTDGICYMKRGVLSQGKWYYP